MKIETTMEYGSGERFSVTFELEKGIGHPMSLRIEDDRNYTIHSILREKCTVRVIESSDARAKERMEGKILSIRKKGDVYFLMSPTYFYARDEVVLIKMTAKELDNFLKECRLANR